MKEKSLVYWHIDRNNEVIYIGEGSITRPYDFYKRSAEWQEHTKMHGIGVEVLTPLIPVEDAQKLESILILRLKPRFNKTVYGSTHKHTEATKIKIGSSRKGKAHSKETRKKLAAKAKNRQMYLDVETGSIMSKANYTRWRPDRLPFIIQL